jgi:serine/threonine-protein kinase
MLQTQAEPKPSITFGPFEILAKLGRGAASTVYQARHLPTGKFAAVKVLAQLAGLEPGVLERFKREFTVIRRIRHPHLVRSVAMGQEKGLWFLVLEFVPGQNLEQRLKHHGPLPLEEAAAIFVQIADGLRFLHANSI